MNFILMALLSLHPQQMKAAVSGHDVNLAWQASPDAAGNPTLNYNVYRLAGACPATAPVTAPDGFTKIASVSTLSYQDNSVPLGANCYFVTAVLSGAESQASNDAAAVILPLPPGSLVVVSAQVAR